jgi:hypothetical protein
MDALSRIRSIYQMTDGELAKYNMNLIVYRKKAFDRVQKFISKLVCLDVLGLENRDYGRGDPLR